MQPFLILAICSFTLTENDLMVPSHILLFARASYQIDNMLGGKMHHLVSYRSRSGLKWLRLPPPTCIMHTYVAFTTRIISFEIVKKKVVWLGDQWHLGQSGPSKMGLLYKWLQHDREGQGLTPSRSWVSIFQWWVKISFICLCCIENSVTNDHLNLVSNTCLGCSVLSVHLSTKEPWQSPHLRLLDDSPFPQT